MANIIIRDVNEDLRKRLRMICLEDDVSMNAQLKILIEKYVESREKKVEKKK